MLFGFIYYVFLFGDTVCLPPLPAKLPNRCDGAMPLSIKEKVKFGRQQKTESLESWRKT
jgi:hypothetical protein